MKKSMRRTGNGAGSMNPICEELGSIDGPESSGSPDLTKVKVRGADDDSDRAASNDTTLRKRPELMTCTVSDLLASQDLEEIF